MESCVTDLGKTYVEKLINGTIAELRHVFCFTSIADEFKVQKNSLEGEIKTLEQHAQVAAGNDKAIEAKVLDWKEKAQNLVQEDIQIKQSCFFGLCPDCIWRYKKGKELANNNEEIKQLIEKAGKFGNIGVDRRLPDIVRYSSKDYISFPSRESKYKELLDALKDDNNYKIVLQGMGGTGKTTLAKEVGKVLKKSEQFAHVIDTTVSFTPDTKKIQDDIAGPLGLKWEGCNDSDRPKKLWSRLTTDEKVLIILDDVWDGGPPLDFDLIGIPNHHKGCRVLITTRSKRISDIMRCKKIELDLLSEEEAWAMFKTYVGPFPESLISTGCEIAKECKQLPVAIAVIARSLIGYQDRKHKWDVTLKSLKKTVFMDDVDKEKVGIYKCLKSSYDRMEDEKAKGLFLLSSVFPEDKEIPIELLTRLGIGTGLFKKNYEFYDDARSQVAVAIDILINSCLLVGVGEKHVKMHDLVREAAQWTACKEIRHVNLLNKDEKLSVEKEKNMKYLFCEGMDMDLFSWKYNGPKLETLIVEVESDGMDVPNDFFENIGNLQVLYFSGLDILLPISLPDSIHSLSNIRSILVDGVHLGDISVLGNLQNLETLDLVSCLIDELPQEIAKLGEFKLLKLEDCEIKRNDPFNVIESCTTLQELYFIDNNNDSCREITLPELKRYRISKWQTMHIDSLSKYLSFDAGNGGECFFSKETFKYFMQRTEGLELERINEGWRNLMPEIVPIYQGMKDLVDLRLKCISQLQCLVDTNDSQSPNVLSNLVVLDLDDMENLEVLFHGSLSFDSLKNLEKVSIKECKKLRILFNCNLNLCNLKTVTLWGCPLLVDLSPMLTSRNMVMLEELKISSCEGLKNLVIDEGDNDDKSHGPMFPKLRVLYIARCDRLELIFPFLSIQDLPVLEVIDISHCDKLKYVFGKYQNVEHSSLKEIKLLSLTNFMGLFPENSLVNKSSSTSRDGFKALSQVDPIKCNFLSWSGICCHEDPLQNNSSASVSSSHDRLQIREHAQCFQVRLLNLCNVTNITLHGILKIKSVFILSITPRMMLETLNIMDCDDLKHIIVDIGDDDSGGKNWGNVFPKLKRLQVHHCKKLEYIVGHHTDEHQNHTKIRLHLPTLECLDLFNLPSLIAMCVKQYTTTFPSLKWKFLCSNVAIKSIGVFMVSHSDSESLDNTTEELSGSMDHLIALKSLMVYNSKGEIYFCLNGTKGQPINLGPKNSFALQNLTEIKIEGCEKLEIVFSNSISTCLSQLHDLRIEECKELKHIIEDDDASNSLSPRIFFPKLKKLLVIKCHKLKCVFPVSICKELPELEILMIREAHELEVIFKSNGDQKSEIPNLNFVVLFDLPSLFDAQGIQLEQIRSIENCPKLLSLTSASGFVHRIPNLQDDTSSENSSVETITNADVGVEIEVEAILGDELTSSQKLETEQFTSQQGSINLQDLIGKIDTAIKPSQCVKETNEKSIQEDYMTITASTHLELVSSSQTSEQDLDVGDYPKTTMVKDIQGFVHRIPNLQDDTSSENSSIETTTNADVGVEIEVEAILGDEVTYSQKLQNEQSINQQGSINQQDSLGEIDTAIKPSQCVKETNDQGIQEDYLSDKIVAATISEITNEPPIQLVSPKLKGVEEWAALRNAKTITTSTNLELVGSSQMSEQDVADRYPLETTKVNDDQDFQNSEHFESRFQQLEETTKDVVVGVGTEVEPPLGHKLTSSQIITKQTPQEDHELTENASNLKTPSVAVLVTSSKELEKEQPRSEQGLIKQQDPHGEIDTTIKSSQEQDVDDRDSLEIANVNDNQDFQTREHFESRFKQLEDETKGYNTSNENPSAETTKDIVVGVASEIEAALGHTLTSSQIIMKQTPEVEHELQIPSVTVLPTSSKELKKEQPPSQQRLTNQQNPLGEIDTSIKPSQGVEEGTALTNAKAITASTHSELSRSSQVKEQDVDVRDTLETTVINDDRDSLNEDVVIKESPIIEEQFSKGDGFTILKSKPSPSNSVPMPLSFQAASMDIEGNPSQNVEDLSSAYLVTRKLEELVSNKHLDYENLSLLTDFFVKHPSILLSDKHSNGYKGHAYKFLTKLLKFLQTHSVLDVLGSCNSEFVELVHDVRSFSFDKDWLDGVEKRALFPDLEFSQDSLQKLLDSKKQITEDVEVMRFKIDILTRDVEELKQQLSSSEADLESVIQREKEIVESKVALSVPLGY